MNAALAELTPEEVGAMQAIFAAVGAELGGAMEKFGPMASPHEGLAVIWEELEELKKEVFENRGRDAQAFSEAVQIAAMAIRYVFDITPRESPPTEGSPQA